MSSFDYHPLSQDRKSETNEESIKSRDRNTSISRSRSVVTILTTLFALSLSINTVLIYQRVFQPWHLYNDLPSQFAHLRRDTLRPVVPPHEYSSLNRTIQDAAWADRKLISWDLFVALDEEYVITQGLPHSQRWPWDSNKGVYITRAAHEMHCLHVIRSFANGKQDGLSDDELDWSYAHTLHCLNILRETIMCNADDHPMYTGRLHDNVYFEEAVPGRGTFQVCRNWDALVDWAYANSACYLSVNRSDPNFAEIDRYKFCPDGSRPWENLIDDEKS